MAKKTVSKNQSQFDAQTERLARGLKLFLMRSTAAAGITAGTVATLSHFNASGGNTGFAAPIKNSAPANPLPFPGRTLPEPQQQQEDAVLVHGRARAMQASQVTQVSNDTHQPQNQAASAAMNEDVVFEEFIDHLLLREGFENEVYKDTLGVLTVGVGHRVLDSDNLREGDTISNERVRQFLYQDARKAFDAAKRQAAELGIRNNPDFIVALASVNFQLGTGWNRIHKKTWALMEQGRFREAADEAANSRWYRQTPVRVRDFQTALRALEPAPVAQLETQSKISADFKSEAVAQSDKEPYKIQAVALRERETNGASVLYLAA